MKTIPCDHCEDGRATLPATDHHPERKVLCGSCMGRGTVRVDEESPDIHYGVVLHALGSENPGLVQSVIAVTRAADLPYPVRKDIERLIADELFHNRVPLAPEWAAFNVWLGGLP